MGAAQTSQHEAPSMGPPRGCCHLPSAVPGRGNRFPRARPGSRGFSFAELQEEWVSFGLLRALWEQTAQAVPAPACGEMLG